MEAKYLNPKADPTFKLVFGEHPDLVMSLLNALLPLPADAPIVSVEYLTPEMVPENPGKKNSVVDVRCKDQHGRQFIVEMQLYWNSSFQQRVILNASKAVIKQLNKREDYRLIQPVYCLNLVNEVGFKSGPDEFYHDYAIVNVAHSDRIIEGLRFVFVELPKFKPRTVMEKKMAVLWLRFLTEISEETTEAPAELLANEAIRKALGIVEKSAMSEAQLNAYERFWDAVINEEVHYQDGYNKGIEHGIQQGIEQGIQQGIEQGIQQGIEQGQRHKALESARLMKQKGYRIDDIAEITGLSGEEIEKSLT